MVRLLFQPAADNQRGPKYLEGLIAGWASLCGRHGISVGLVSRRGRVQWQLDVPDDRQRLIAAQLVNAYPGSRIDVLREPVQSGRCYERWLRLSPDILPLKLHREFIEEHSREAIDPMDGLLEAIKAGRSGRIEREVWLHFRPARPRVVQRMTKYAPYVSGEARIPFLLRWLRRCVSSKALLHRFLTWMLHWFITPQDLPQDVSNRLHQHLLEVELRVAVISEKRTDQHQRLLSAIKAAFTQFTAADVFLLVANKRVRFQLTCPEVASIWHPPIQSVHVPRLLHASYRQLESPENLPTRENSPGSVTLGRVAFRNEQHRFAMDLDARRRHLLTIGKTGMGKTTLLKNILAEDIASGRGVAVIEPHGDLCADTLNLIPKHRTNEVILFDPADTNYPIAFNPLQVPKGGDATIVADGVLSAFQRIFGLEEGNAPRLLHIFRNCLLSLVEMPAASLMSVQRLLVNDAYRQSVVARVSNPVVQSFWLDEFAKWKPHDRTAFIASLQNKLGAFLTNDKLQRILGQPEGKLDLRKAMDTGRILIVNLSKGRVGENASDLLGSLLLTSLQIATMTRADIPEEQRRDFTIVVDECQNYATPSIATFLSEARKYRASLILSHQFTAQLPDAILASILGNVGSMIAFQLGVEDAEFFSRQFGNLVSPNDLMNMPKYHAWCRLLIDGTPSRPFSMTTLPPCSKPTHRSAIIRDRSRRTYARPKTDVDGTLRDSII